MDEIYERSDGGQDDLVSACCGASPREEHDWMHATTLYECTACGFECELVPATPFDE